MELFQGINDEPLKKCPACKKKKLRRLFGAGAGILFKGSGFYQTDYRSDSYKQKAASDKPASTSDSKSSSESKSSSDSSSSASSGAAASGKDSKSSGGSSSSSRKPSD